MRVDRLSSELRSGRAKPDGASYGGPQRAGLRRWFGPKGWPPTLREVDFRPGGRFRFAMTGPSGEQNTPLGGEYPEIVPNRRIVFDNSFEQPGSEKMVVTEEVLGGRQAGRRPDASGAPQRPAQPLHSLAALERAGATRRRRSFLSRFVDKGRTLELAIGWTALGRLSTPPRRYTPGAARVRMPHDLVSLLTCLY